MVSTPGVIARRQLCAAEDALLTEHNGTATLFAALDTRDGKLVSLCQPRRGEWLQA